MKVVRSTDGFLEASLYGRDLNPVVHSIFEKLCEGNYETLLHRDHMNTGVYGHSVISDAAQRPLRTGVQLYTIYHSRHRNINGSVKS